VGGLVTEKERTDTLVRAGIGALTRYRTSHDKTDYSTFRDVKRELYEIWGKDRVKPILRFIIVKSGWANAEKAVF
jgi:hypothetical protein